jgi:TolA-binding protein
MARIEVPKNSDVQFFARDFSSTDPLEAEGKAANQRSRNLAQLSSEMFKQGRYRAASIEMEKALVKSGVAPPSWRHQLAKSLLKIGKINDAKIVLNRVIDDYPRDGSAYFILGNLAYEKSEFERAWRFFVRAYFLNPFLDGLFEKMLVIQQRKPELAKDYVILDTEL